MHSKTDDPFDAVHVGQAVTLDEPLVSTDTLHPTIDEIDHLDPRDRWIGPGNPCRLFVLVSSG